MVRYYDYEEEDLFIEDEDNDGLQDATEEEGSAKKRMGKRIQRLNIFGGTSSIKDCLGPSAL